jgi:hypothetical protein
MRPMPVLALLLACLSLGFTACGDDDDGDGGASGPQPFEVAADEKGVTAPDSVRPGAIELRFSNSGKKEHSAQVVSIADGHTAEEVKKAGEAWGQGQGPLPEWLTFLGGAGSTKPGGSAIAVVDLSPGEYAVFDMESDAREPYAVFTVEGDEGAGLDEVPASVEASEYTFRADGLRSGSQRVLFENAGDEPHHLVGAPLAPGKTEADLRKFLKLEQAGKAKGPPPIVEDEGFDTAVVSGGESTVVDLRLESGDYAFLCFVPDRKGGPPHAFQGMAIVTTVE